MTKRTHNILLLSLLAASAVVRIVFFFQAKNMDLFSEPILDCRHYHTWALRLLAGDWDWNEAYWMGPLYPHLLAVGYRLFGSGHQVVMAVQLALSLVNIWLVYRVGRGLLSTEKKQTDGVSKAENIALMAALFYGFYGAPVFYAGLKLMAVLATTTMLLIAMQAMRCSAHGTVRNWFLLGLLVGFGGLARGNFLIFLAAFPLLLWHRGTPLITRKHSMMVLALWLGGMVMIAPATLRNIFIGHDFVLLTSNGGVNLLVGQQTSYNGTFAPIISELQAENDPTMALELESEVGHALKGSQISRMLSQQAWQLFQKDIKAMPLHYGRKAFRFWNGYELPQIASYDYWRQEIPALKLLAMPFMVLSALGLLGLLSLPKGGAQQGRRILLIILLGYFVSLMPFFPTARYRQPIVPFLAIASAVYLFQLARLSWTSDPDKTRPLVLTQVVIACFMVLLMHPIWTALDPAMVKWQVAMNEAVRAGRMGNQSLVLQKGKQAEDCVPGMAWTPFSLAGNLEDLEAWDEAYLFYEKAEKIIPNNRIIPYRMGRNREHAGQYLDALKSYGRAAKLDPRWSYPYLRSSVILRKSGKKEQALAAINKAAILAPGSFRVRSNQGSLLAETGNLSEARTVLQALTVDFPNYVNGWFNLALLETQMGHKKEARQILKNVDSIAGLTEVEQDQILKLRAVLQQ